MDIPCDSQICVTQRECERCGRIFYTIERDQSVCDRCQTPDDPTWTPFRPH